MVFSSLLEVNEQDIPSLSASDLKRLLSVHNVSFEGCFEKQEFVQLAIATKRSLPHEEQQPAIVPYFGKQERANVDLYALLEVPKTATLQEITRAYYRLARDNHPDKNPNNPFAEEKFKQISEAYQILSDPEKRKTYDQYGMAGVGPENFDPKELFKMLFGGKKFDNIFGNLSFFDLDLSNPNGPDAAWERKQEENSRELVHQLLIKVEPFVQGMKSEFCKMVEAEAKELVDVPGGQELLHLVGYVYVQEAKQHLDTFLGIPAFFSRVAEKGHMMGLAIDTMKHVVKMQAAQAKMERDQKMPEMDAQAQISPEMAMLLQEGLKAIWSIGKIEIDQILRRVCETTLQDTHVHKTVRKARAKAMKMMGEIFEKVARSTMISNNNLFQQGPFAVFDQQQQRT